VYGNVIPRKGRGREASVVRMKEMSKREGFAVRRGFKMVLRKAWG